MTAWHAPADTLTRYGRAPDTVDAVTASSIEAHIVACEACRRVVALAAPPLTLSATWDAIADRIDRPRRTIAERALAWVLPDHMARVVAATAALRFAWLCAVAVVVATFVLFAREIGSDAPFLALAPLVPLAGVAASFGPASDPAGETAIATAMHGAGLVLWRSVAVLATSLALLGVGSLALPGFELRDLAWVLPAIALTSAAVALSTWVAPFNATAVAAVVWLMTMQAVPVFDGASRAVAESSLFGVAGQACFAVLLALALLLVGVRRPHFSTLEAR